jgi:hypothetical protein
MFLPEFPASMLDESMLGHPMLTGLMTDHTSNRQDEGDEQRPPERMSAPARLRLVGCRIDRQAAARSRVSVEFEGPWFKTPLISQQEGTTCPGGDLRLAARATLDALTTATAGEVTFDLIGVKPSRAFDTNVMLVAVMVRHGGTSTKALGVAVDEDNTVLATVRATFHAVNRFVSPLLGPLPVAE